MLSSVEKESTKEKQIELMQSYAKTHPHFKHFLHWAFFNKRKPAFSDIPPYKTNMVDITFSYIKLEKAIPMLRFFFEGPDMIPLPKKREDRLLSILEEMSWLETPVYEQLIMNKYKNPVLNKKLVKQAFPDMEDIA